MYRMGSLNVTSNGRGGNVNVVNNSPYAIVDSTVLNQTVNMGRRDRMNYNRSVTEMSSRGNCV